jgi:transcription-repair coupling factor (superfamily II helicase)
MRWGDERLPNVDKGETVAEPPRQLGLSETAAALAAASASGDVFFVAADEPRAAAIAAALAAAAPEAEVIFCPGSDALPGDSAPPSPGNAGQRAAALRRLRLVLESGERRAIILVTTAEATARLYAAPAAFGGAPPAIAVGDAIDLEAFAAQMQEIGYFADDRVDEPGEIAVRGQVVDVYPADAGMPYRIEAQAGQVLAIRSYDPQSQRTTAEVERLELGRVKEPDARDSALLLDHLPDAQLAQDDQAEARRARFLALAADVQRRAPRRTLRDVIQREQWAEAAAKRPKIDLAADAGDPPPRFVEGERSLDAFAKFAQAEIDEGNHLVLVGSARDLRFLRRVEKVLGRLPEPVASWVEAIAAPAASVSMLEAPADRGFRRGEMVAIAATDLLGSRAETGAQPYGASVAELFQLGEIAIGDVVVHEDHGIGVVTGVTDLPGGDGGDTGDAISLRYANDSTRLVPVADADRIWRYGADEDAVTLDRLDGSSWQERRGAIAAAVAESARALTALAAERAARTAPVLDPDPAAFERFAAGFAFTETADQARAIAAVRADLSSGKPMDRLLIGDVGYGKTEVAMRAAALAALAGRQVAIAAPTTVLARQHLEQFTRRFEDTGIAVAGLSRLSSPAEKRRVKAGLADKSIGVVIGTGAVAGKGVSYADLALVIIDEEQRFGAADKARLRDLSAGHVLTLSATPIPRTLQNALIGLQQLSILATPPARRQPIRTAIGAFDPETLRTALMREHGRGGQSFVVVPRIEDMAPIAERLAKLVPELEILQAHGKMPAADIDDAMVRFAGGEGDVLLATNIIEAGLDVPRANTMAIWRADRFGLSQLHQLRGRVGRGSRRGQLLLLTAPDANIAPRTLARLRTLQAFDQLGAGFAISARDLDMRGAGDLLGEAQAGHMKLIGIDLYQHLLEGALREARGETVVRWTPELNIGIAGRLPESWVPDAEQRVTLYTRLARVEDADALDAFQAELEDRFGELPEDARTLLDVAALRIAARDARIARVDAGAAAIALTPRREFDASLDGIEHERKDGRLLFKEKLEDPTERLTRVREIMSALTQRGEA